MKNLSSFEAFKLNKRQMNAITGGTERDAVLCRLDDEDELVDILTAPEGMTSEQAQRSLEKAYGEIYSVECYDVHYVT